MRTLSLGSGVWDGEEDWVHLRPTPNSPSWTRIERGEGQRSDRMREGQWYVLNVYFVFRASKILCIHFFVTLCRNPRIGHFVPQVNARVSINPFCKLVQKIDVSVVFGTKWT